MSDPTAAEAATSATNADNMSEAQKRAAARKAKILARGGAGLAKLATAARGEEGSTLYDSTIPSRSSTPQIPTSTTNSAGRDSPAFGGRSDANSSSRTGPSGPAGISQPPVNPEMDAMMRQMMEMLGGGAGAGPSGGGDPMEQMRRLLSGAGSDTPDLSQVDPTADPPSPTLAARADPFASMFPGGAGGLGAGLDSAQSEAMAKMFGGGAGGGFPGQSSAAVKPSRSARIFPLVHFLAMLALWAFTCIWWEPSLYAAKWGTAAESLQRAGLAVTGKIGWSGPVVQKWSLLKGDTGGFAHSKATFEPIPIFWAFTTIELILQTTRLMIFKKPPRPPAMVDQFLPLLPPNLSRNLIVVLRYSSLLMQVWKDGCLLLFLIGVTIAMV